MMKVVAMLVVLSSSLVVGCAASTGESSDSGDEAAEQSQQALADNHWYQVIWPTAGCYAGHVAIGYGCMYPDYVKKDFHAGHWVYQTGEVLQCNDNKHWSMTQDNYGNGCWIRTAALQ